MKRKNREIYLVRHSLIIIPKGNTAKETIKFSKKTLSCDILKYESCLGILIWIFLHQVLDYHDVSMRAYNRISHCTWFYIAAIWYMLDVVAYICNYTYKFLDATLFMLDVQALGYSDTETYKYASVSQNQKSKIFII